MSQSIEITKVSGGGGDGNMLPHLLPVLDVQQQKCPLQYGFDKHLFEVKDQINDVANLQWRDVVGKNTKIDSSIVRPVSRAFFKIKEIIEFYNLTTKINKDSKVITLCEAPGGFIEFFYKTFGIKSYVLTLLREKTNNYDKRVPNIHYSLQKCCFQHNGIDGTGDICNPENIMHFINAIGPATADLITADGGFDVSGDWNDQEIISSQLIFSEMITALALQKNGGTFILKMFDTFTELSVQLLYVLSSCYQSVHIFKPNTSRPSNSEKYIVCQNFKGVSDKFINNALGILVNWQEINSKHLYIHRILDTTIGQDFIHRVTEANILLMNKQINSITQNLNKIK